MSCKVVNPVVKIRQGFSERKTKNLRSKANFYYGVKLILLGLVVLGGLLFLQKLPVQAVSNDILVYYTISPGIGSHDIYVSVLNSLGYNVIIRDRGFADELGITPAATINLLDYGQVWIIDIGGIAFTASEVTAVETFRNGGGGLLLSTDDTTGNIANQIARGFNNNADIFFGSFSTGGDCITPGFYFPFHPLYNSITALSSTDSDHGLDIQNFDIKAIAELGVPSVNPIYGAVLDEAGKGRIVFDTSVRRFTWIGLKCSNAEVSQYQQNIAQWLVAIPPCNSTDCSSPITNPCKCGTLVTTAADNGKYCCAGNNAVYNTKPLCQVGACTLPPPPCSTGGLVPCGRSCDDPSTLDIDESKPCQLCHLFVMLDKIIDFLLVYILFPIAVLMLVFAGLLYIGPLFEVLPGESLNQVKGIIFSVVLGLIIIFVAFILIGLLLMLVGLADWTTNIYQSWWSQGLFQIKCEIK